ncbi:hypothetical protein LINPERHAP1_LOCUS22348, partial [Linum perenne]
FILCSSTIVDLLHLPFAQYQYIVGTFQINYWERDICIDEASLRKKRQLVKNVIEFFDLGISETFGTKERRKVNWGRKR